MKTIVSAPTPCPSCGKPMPAGALAGLCPACLLAQGAETATDDTARSPHFVPPPVEEVARLFPQLEILSLLGAGGMGAVYKARQPALDRFVALKVLPAASGKGVNFEERFNREARALARLSHPNIVAVFEFGQAGDLHFFIMEFVDGANLRQLEQAGRLSSREALQIIPQICDALQYAHDEGVVHRDIKPENVLVDRKGRVKIADFGLAKILGLDAEALRLTAEGQVMGTPHYMAPEQVEKPLTVDHRADIYSLGVVFYEMLTGDLPLGKFSPPSRKVQVDVRLDEVVLRALENDPARRYQHASEVKSRVETIAGTPGAASTPPAASGPGPTFLRWAGFPLVIEREGGRKVNWKEALKAFAILFGLFTILFGLVSLFTGRTLFGWLGISGHTSLQVRLLAAALLTAFGVWRALRAKARVESLPQTPKGTAILPGEKLSRKAVIAVCWAPFAFLAAFSFYSTMAVVHVSSEAAKIPEPSIQWWQILLMVTVLPLGLTAPFGTTILGWLAVGDIRRSLGRIRGLPLAVFAGLFFPLLAFDGLLAWLWTNAVRALVRGPEEYWFNPPWPAITSIGAVVICLIATFEISRRVWRAVRLTASTPQASGDWWWSRTPGAVAIGLVCLAIIVATALRRDRQGIFKNPPHQVASVNTRTGALGVTLPNGALIELSAVTDAGSAADEWWSPVGRRIGGSSISVEGLPQWGTPGVVPKDLVFRLNTPLHAGQIATIQADPASGWVVGTQAQMNGQSLTGAVPVRMAWPDRVQSATVRLGLGMATWQTLATFNPKNHTASHRSVEGALHRGVEFHQSGQGREGAMLTFLYDEGNERTQLEMVAVDEDGAEHRASTTSTTAAGRRVTATCSYPVPLDRVKEFRAQVRPIHWVEFRDVALKGRSLAKPAPPAGPKSIQPAVLDRDTGRLVARLQPRGTVELFCIADDGAAPNSWWDPRGGAMPDTLFEVVNPDRARDPARVNRQFVVRMRDLPSGTDGPSVEFVGGYGGSGGRAVLRNGQALDGGWLLSGSWPAATTRSTIRLGFGLAPWQTFSVSGVDGKMVRRETSPGLPPVEMQIHQVSESEGEAQLTMLAGYPMREWQMKLVAIDQEGKENFSSSSRGTVGEPGQTSVLSHRFWRLPLAQVKEFRIMMRPLHWVEFGDIPLHPADRNALGRSARPLVPAAWGAAQEVHIAEYFDFDKGIKGVFPTAPDGTKTYRNTYRNPSWARENGFDVEAGTNELRVAPMFIIDLQPSDWDTLSIPDFEKKMNIYYGPPVLPSTKNAKLPLTHGFKTSEGAMGILQITGFDPGTAGVRLRYKLIERAHFQQP